MANLFFGEIRHSFKLQIHICRIAKALKESENYGERSMTGNNNISRNRKTIIRMQSKSKFSYSFNFSILKKKLHHDKISPLIIFNIFIVCCSGSNCMLPYLLDSIPCHANNDGHCHKVKYMDTRPH